VLDERFDLNPLIERAFKFGLPAVAASTFSGLWDCKPIDSPTPTTVALLFVELIKTPNSTLSFPAIRVCNTC